MDAVAERQVALGIAVDGEAIGVREPTLVTVRPGAHLRRMLETLGDVALLAFSAGQDATRALDWLSLLGCMKALVRGRSEVLRLRRHGRRRAREAPWMLEQPWESLLEQPTSEQHLAKPTVANDGCRERGASPTERRRTARRSS